MHSKDITHRDLKLENIMITKQSGQIVIKILDFGNSSLSKDSVIMSELCGTLFYIAPEVL